ncbi:hypothetical protein LguiA_013490 [Lonicera macranthoides]
MSQNTFRCIESDVMVPKKEQLQFPTCKPWVGSKIFPEYPLSYSDGETFISVDDLRINLWNLEISNKSFNIVDVKPANMEELTDVMTSAKFHPTHCNMLAYSSLRGSIRFIDLWQLALCNTHSKLKSRAGICCSELHAVDEKDALGNMLLLNVGLRLTQQIKV